MAVPEGCAWVPGLWVPGLGAISCVSLLPFICLLISGLLFFLVVCRCALADLWASLFISGTFIGCLSQWPVLLGAISRMGSVSIPLLSVAMP